MSFISTTEVINKKYAEQVSLRSLNILDNYISGIEKNVNVHASINSLAEQISHDYSERIPLLNFISSVWALMLTVTLAGILVKWVRKN